MADQWGVLDPVRAYAEIRFKIIGALKAVNFNKLGDIAVPMLSNLWIPIGMVTTNGVHCDTAANMGTAQFWSGPGATGTHISNLDPAPPNANGANAALSVFIWPNGSTVNSISQTTCYLHISVADGGSPDPLADVYFFGVDLSNLP